MSLTFYYAPMSTASTVHWTLDELAVPYEAVRVDLQNAADKESKLAKINPNLKVPALVHEGVAIFESAAIQLYLGETFGVDKGLFPAAGPARGEAMAWMVWANVSLGEALARRQRHLSDRFPAVERNAQAGESASKDVDHLLGLLDRRLQGRSHVLGERLSIVDFHLSSFVHYVGMCGVDLSRLPKLSAWMQACTTRPAYAKLMAG